MTRHTVLVGVLTLAAGSSAAAADVEHMRTLGSSTSVDVGRALGDVVAVDSYLNVEGVVRGHVFSVDSEILLDKTAVVLGSMTINRGRLTIRPGAVLPKMIYLNDAGFSGPSGQAIDFGQTIKLANGATEVSLDQTVVSTVSVALMKQVLPFDRFVPQSDRTIADLRDWHPGLGLDLRRAVRQPTELTVGGIARLTFVSDKVQGAFQRGYAVGWNGAGDGGPPTRRAERCVAMGSGRGRGPKDKAPPLSQIGARRRRPLVLQAQESLLHALAAVELAHCRRDSFGR